MYIVDSLMCVCHVLETLTILLEPAYGINYLLREKRYKRSLERKVFIGIKKR